MRIGARSSLLSAFLCSALVGCGGGSSASNSTGKVAPTLTSIGLTPPGVLLSPGGTQQLAVVGTYSDGTTQTLAAGSEVFQSSSPDVVSVSVTGLVTVSESALPGSSATISATDTASGEVTSTANTTLVTVQASAAPTANSATAVMLTAENNAQCTVIQPFYWEIGNQEVALASGSSTAAGGTPVTSSSKFPIASASKWIYGMYVVQQRGAAGNLTASDIRFLTFQSGYTYMGSDTSGPTCTAPGSGANSINYCLTLPSATTGEFMNSQNPATEGVFDYDSGHEENHAGQFQPEINSLDTTRLGAAIVSGLGVSGITLYYNQPLLAGGIYASADDYSPVLRAVLSGQLAMLGALGSNPVCAWSVGSGCNAAYSPIYTQHWHYSITHWVEDDPTNGDGAFSSPGAFGFYPWIEANKHYYGVISRYAAANGEIQNGLQSALCGHELRAAWETGQQQ
jgi:Bacterial Ig-like domain (group 2)